MVLADHLALTTYAVSAGAIERSMHAIVHLTGGGFWENIPRVLQIITQ